MIIVDRQRTYRTRVKRGNLQPLSLVVLGETTGLFYVCWFCWLVQYRQSLAGVRKSLQIDTRNTTSLTFVLWQNLPHKDVKPRTGMFRE